MIVTSRTTITTSKVAQYMYQGTATGEIRLKWVITIGLVYDLIRSTMCVWLYNKVGLGVGARALSSYN